MAVYRGMQPRHAITCRTSGLTSNDGPQGAPCTALLNFYTLGVRRGWMLITGEGVFSSSSFRMRRSLAKMLTPGLGSALTSGASGPAAGAGGVVPPFVRFRPAVRSPTEPIASTLTQLTTPTHAPAVQPSASDTDASRSDAHESFQGLARF
jgi:hypothetical protein